MAGRYDRTAEEHTGFREKINANKWPVLSAIALLLVISYFAVNRPLPKPKAFYTVDDGKTWFADTLKAVPFTYHGQEADRAYVFSCDGGKTTFCAYVMRYKPEATQLAQDRIDKKVPAGPESGMEVKRPGDTEWVSAFDPLKVNPDNIKQQQANGKKFEEIGHITCPDGGSGTPALINPQ